METCIFHVTHIKFGVQRLAYNKTLGRCFSIQVCILHPLYSDSHRVENKLCAQIIIQSNVQSMGCMWPARGSFVPPCTSNPRLSLGGHPSSMLCCGCSSNQVLCPCTRGQGSMAEPVVWSIHIQQNKCSFFFPPVVKK